MREADKTAPAQAKVEPVDGKDGKDGNDDKKSVFSSMLGNSKEKSDNLPVAEAVAAPTANATLVSGGDPIYYFTAITHEPTMFKKWKKTCEMHYEGQTTHDAKDKNTWAAAIDEWTGNVDKIYFGAYLGKASESEHVVVWWSESKAGETVFVTSDGLLKQFNDSQREFELLHIDPKDGHLGFKRKRGGLGVFGGKRKRKSHRKSHKKTQKKHKKQMKKSHKKVHKKKTRGKKC